MIVCIGLPRTGTSSLCAAYRLLGLKVVHGAGDYGSVDADVFSDAPWWTPGAILATRMRDKLVCTVRDYESWSRSMLAHFSGMGDDPVMHPVDYIAYRALFGHKPFPLTPEKLSVAYDAHAWAAMFARPTMLTICTSAITDRQKWEAVCATVGLEVPDIPFPHENATGSVLPA